MARLFKWVLGIIGAVIVIVLATVVIILYSYDFNNLKPLISGKAFDATGRELTIESDIDLDIGFSPSLVLSGIKFQNADWGSRKEMVKVNRFEIKVSLLPLLKGNIEVNRFILIEPDILIETSETGKTNLEFKSVKKITGKPSEKPEEPEEEDRDEMKLPSLTINELEIINGTVTYRDGKSGKTETVAIKELKAGVQGLDSPVTFDLFGAYNDQPLNLSGNLGSINSLNNPDIKWPLEVAGNVMDVFLNLDGTIKNPVNQQGINLNFDVKVKSWNRLSKLVGQEIPLKDPLSLSGNINDSVEKVYNIKELKILLGNNQIKGSFAINISGKVPYFDIAMSSKELDLRPYLKQEEIKEKAEDQTGEQPSQKSEKIFPGDPLPLDSLKVVNAHSEIRFEKIIIPQAVIGNLALDTDLKNGNLSIKPFSANIGEGSINLDLDITPKGRTAVMTTELKVKNFEIGDILNEPGSQSKVEGIINADINLKGQGSSVASIMGGLSGYSTVIMGEGRINNKYLDLLGGSLSETIFRLLNPSKDKKQYTAIKCAVARFDMLNGVADTTALVFNTSMMSVIGNGTVDLGSEKLDISLNPATKGGVAGYSLNLGELTKPFKLGGTLAEPSLVLDKTKAALTIGKAISESGLKGLFGKDGSGVGDENLCVKAIEAAKTGVKLSIKQGTGNEEKTEPIKPRKIIEDVIKDPAKALKGLFGE